jgi:hypothetical protein
MSPALKMGESAMTFLVARKTKDDLLFARRISNTLPWSWTGDARSARWFKDEGAASEALQEMSLPDAFVLEGDELIAQAEQRRLAPQTTDQAVTQRPLLSRLKGLIGG